MDDGLFDIVDKGFDRLISVVLVFFSNTNLTTKEVLFELGF